MNIFELGFKIKNLSNFNLHCFYIAITQTKASRNN